jgi:hypothetical protein
MVATSTCVTDLGGESLCRIDGEQPQNKVDARLGDLLPLQPFFKVILSVPPQKHAKRSQWPPLPKHHVILTNGHPFQSTTLD